MKNLASLSTGTTFKMEHAKDCECRIGRGGDRKTGMHQSSDRTIPDGQTTTTTSKKRKASVKSTDAIPSEPSSSSSSGSKRAKSTTGSTPKDTVPATSKVDRQHSSSSRSITADDPIDDDDEDVFSESEYDTTLLSKLPPKKEEEDKEKPKKKTGQISFDGETYRQHARFLPAAFQPLVKSIAEALEAVDSEKDLFESYMAFFILYFQSSGQIKPEHNKAYATFEAGLPEEDKQLFATMKKAAAALPNLDSFKRSRGKAAMKIYAQVAHPDHPAKSLGVWLLFDFIFRYFGTYKAVEHLFWMDKAAEQSLQLQLKTFYENEEDQAALSIYLQQRIQEVVTCHTSIAAWFEKGDGRRRTFGMTDERLQRFDLCSKYMDHLISAIPHWLFDTAQLGEELYRVSTLVTGGYEDARPGLEKFLLSLSHTTLIGRQVLDNRPLGDHLCSYALKFVNGDIYYVLACLCCGNRNKHCLSVRAACDCDYCQTVRDMRNNYIFMGPSPLILHATVSKEKPSGERTLRALRLFRKLLCEELGVYVDLYGVQMSPCMWRHWLRDIAKDEATHEATKYRLMCQVTLELESDRLIDMREWLTHVEALHLLEKQPIALKREFYLKFKRKSWMGKAEVMATMTKLWRELYPEGPEINLE